MEWVVLMLFFFRPLLPRPPLLHANRQRGVGEFPCGGDDTSVQQHHHHDWLPCLPASYTTQHRDLKRFLTASDSMVLCRLCEKSGRCETFVLLHGTACHVTAGHATAWHNNSSATRVRGLDSRTRVCRRCVVPFLLRITDFDLQTGSSTDGETPPVTE